MEFMNVYEDTYRADSYASLAFPGTYYLAYRDIPELIKQYVTGETALDFGCGTGRSTRFLKDLGFHVTGIDISSEMISHAKSMDPDGNYLLVADGDLGAVPAEAFDLILSVFTFDNIPNVKHKLRILEMLREKLKASGTFINLVSSPVIYVNEWASFTTKDFPENRNARDGDTVKIIMTDVADKRPVEDILCTDERYRQVFQQVGFELLNVHRPLGKTDEPFKWKSETHTSPWCIYILGKCDV